MAVIEVINIAATTVVKTLAERFVELHEPDTKRVWKDASIIVTISMRFVSDDAMPNLV